jgi:hypothetical protein
VLNAYGDTINLARHQDIDIITSTFSREEENDKVVAPECIKIVAMS